MSLYLGTKISRGGGTIWAISTLSILWPGSSGSLGRFFQESSKVMSRDSQPSRRSKIRSIAEQYCRTYFGLWQINSLSSWYKTPLGRESQISFADSEIPFLTPLSPLTSLLSCPRKISWFQPELPSHKTDQVDIVAMGLPGSTVDGHYSHYKLSKNLKDKTTPGLMHRECCVENILTTLKKNCHTQGMGVLKNWRA